MPVDEGSRIPPPSPNLADPLAGRDVLGADTSMQGLPPQVKLEVAGATEVGTNEPSAYDADFIMVEVLVTSPQREQGEQARNPAFSKSRVSEWRVEFPTNNGLHRASLTATPNTDGTLALRAILEGQQQGPAWSNSSVADLTVPVELTFDAEAGETPSAGTDWPQTVSAKPIFEAVPNQGHYISPEPLVAEMALMAAGSGSSCDDVEISVPGILQDNKSDPGAVVVRNHDGNNAPRVQIILNGSTAVTLTRINTGNGRVKVYNLAFGGTEITFNGTDNQFTAAELPKSLYVQGDIGSTVSKDVELVLVCDADLTVFDIVKFTVVWVELSALHSGTVTDDNAAKTFYNNLLLPPKANPNDAPLGYVPTNIVAAAGSQARFGIASEFIGTTQPSDLVPNLYGFLGGELSLEREIVSHTGWYLQVGGAITEIPDPGPFPKHDSSPGEMTDPDPQSGGSAGKIYDLDIPGFGFRAPAIVETAPDFRIRNRENFRYWAEFASIRCSLKKDWYTRLAVKATGERDGGTASGGAANKVIDTTKAWAANKWRDGVVGAFKVGAGGFVQWRRVTASDATSVTVTPNFDPVPQVPYFYTVIANGTMALDAGAPAGDNQNGNGTTKLTWDLT